MRPRARNTLFNKKFYATTNRSRHFFNDDFLYTPLKENPIFTDLKILFLILKAMGLLPIFEQISLYQVVYTTNSKKFYSFVVRCTVHGLTTFQLYHMLAPGSPQWFYSERPSDIRNKWIEIILSITTYTSTVIICGRNEKTFLKIINEILKLDEEICDRFRITLDNKCRFAANSLMLTCVCLAYLIGLRIVASYGYFTKASYILIVFYVIKSTLPIAFVIFVAALLRIITMRFAFLNSILTEYGYNRARVYRPIKRFPENLCVIFHLHNTLLRILKSVNECCGFILLCFMGFTFYTITTNTYNFFVQITTRRHISSEVIQWGVVWFILYSSLLALLSQSCAEVTKEANKILNILARIYCKNKDIRTILDKFLIKHLEQQIHFSAYGFFAIDASTFFKVFLGVATYLVILIQFKQLEDSKMNSANE